MTAESGVLAWKSALGADPHADSYSQLVAALVAVIGPVEALVPAARLEADLGLDSLDLAALGSRLGDGINLPAVLARLGFDQLVELSVAGLAELLAEQVPQRAGQ